MRLTFLAILLMCAALCCVIAYTAWQAGGPGLFEALAAVGSVGVLVWLLPIVWRESGPVHEGGSDEHLRVMPEAERQSIASNDDDNAALTAACSQA